MAEKDCLKTKIALFPEYHLSDFPPQLIFTAEEASLIVRSAKKPGIDIIVAGYVEAYYKKYYSSCIIIDHDNTFNIRKKYPYKDEDSIISPGTQKHQVIPLSLGNSYFFICNDVTQEILKTDFELFLKKNQIRIFFLISAMEKNFYYWLKELEQFARCNNVEKIYYSDRFCGAGTINS